MHRIDTPTAQVDKFGAGKNGFTRGNPQTGVPATALDDDYFDAVQEELAGVVEAAGFALNKANRAQLLAAIQKLVSEGIPDLKDASLTQKGIVQLSNATASNSQILAATPKAVSDLGNLLLKITNNLSEIKDAGPVAVAQTLLNLGLGDAAKKNVGTASGTVAAGNDVRFNETTIMYPDGSGASPYNYPANTRKEYANPFPGKNIIVVAEVYYNGVWGQTGWFSNSTVTNAVGILATQNIVTDVIVVQSGSFGVLAASTLCGSLHAATATQSTLPFRLKVYKEA
ncbi:tail fiber protein [Yersinia enterocolitica]|uniref:phage tail protein n=2 Tax=Yersinia enterocolitica TaxID=630 RepID=UPI0028A55029|nr:tail fiber protein [Yersinia enterocolitica]ELI8060917.1 tail fiber protein [Yersinia enterocolitica]ELI8195107.1 tail fiber protein [Yersinia enterocolitica]ELI8386995.1 tail fiber protein [Yersinia enterocolitica]HDL7190961.1 tail fiber protein [Yersinia enterocolitica]